MKKLFLFIIVSATIYGCKDVVNELPFNTTPYSFSYNSGVLLPPRTPSNNPLTQEGVQLGRMLFYDPILSGDSTQSCSSCHNQANAFTDNGKKFSIGINEDVGKRNSMPIFNLMWHLDGFFWDGRAENLFHQTLMPVQDPTEMDETIGNVLVKLNRSTRYKEQFKKAFDNEVPSEELLSKALEQFMLSIVSANSKYDRVQMGLAEFTDQEKVGQIIFNSEAIPLREENDPQNPKNYGADCFHCHGNSLFMSREFLNNGLSATEDNGRGAINGNPDDDCKFKTPTLRNIDKTAPYMHDGRFNSLEEVVNFYLGPMQDNCTSLSNVPNLHALKDSVYLSPEHKAALVSFLKTLTDETLLTNEEYSNPFK